MMTIVSHTAEKGRLTYGNLNNQRIAFCAAIIACKHFKASLVMPLWHIGGNQYVHFGHLWDADNLLRRAAADGVTIATPGLAKNMDECAAEVMQESLDTRMSVFKSKQQSTLCVTSSELFYEIWKQNLTEREKQIQGAFPQTIVAESAQFAEARHWLMPSRWVAKRAKKVVENLVSSNQTFYGIHIRTEGDFAHACSVWDARIDGLRCWLDIYDIADEVDKHGVVGGSLLYVFPAQDLENLSALCGAKYRCIHRDMADPAQDLAYNEKALLDYAIVGQAAGVFGNIYSTMSVEVIASARANAKPAAYLNTPCPESSTLAAHCP